MCAEISRGTQGKQAAVPNTTPACVCGGLSIDAAAVGSDARQHGATWPGGKQFTCDLNSATEGAEVHVEMEPLGSTAYLHPQPHERESEAQKAAEWSVRFFSSNCHLLPVSISVCHPNNALLASATVQFV